MTLRSRVLLGMVAIAVVLIASAFAITRATRGHLVGQIDQQLQEARPRLPGRSAPPPEGAPRFSDVYVGWIDRDGELTTVFAPDLRGEAADVPTPDPGEIARLRAGEIVSVDSDGDTRYRMLARAEGRLGAMAVLALPLDDVAATLRRLIAVEALAVASVLAVLGLVAWWVIRLGVRPIHQMTETATAIAAGDLSLRVPAPAPGTEAAALGAALNGMLTRIEAAFDERTATEGRLRQFAADASHELRTPITTIRGYAELFRTGALADPDELAEAMRRTEQEAVRMGHLVEDLLLLARLDQGRPLERAPVDLAALAQDAVRDALAAAPDRHVTADAATPVVVDGDEARLRQVVANLLGNAVLHAPAADIRVTVRGDGDRAVLEVHDTGPGMSDTDAARAVERFYRADASRSRHQGGSGLGLAIADATIRALGGALHIESELGRGTIVRASLPIHVDEPSPVGPPA